MYQVKKVNEPPALNAGWDSAAWNSAEIIRIDTVRPESTAHHPATNCKMLHDNLNIYGLFQVKDRYVRAVTENYNEQVCKDSCVEFFVEPSVKCGYFNFEFSANGTFLLYHVRDHRRGHNGFADFNPVSAKSAGRIQVFHSLSGKIDPEIDVPTTWELGFKIPLALFADETKQEINELSGKTWRANFYKCGDKTSHPHWISWQPIDQKNFHLPENFGEISFE